MKKIFRSRILLFAGLLALLVSCAPARKEETVKAPTPVPAIAAPTGEPERLSVYTPSPEPKKEPAPGQTALVISEVSVSGCSTAARLNGIEGEWIELYNASAAAAELSGFSLSDREDNVLELILPRQTVLPGAYALVDLAGAPFRLKPGETVYLFDNETWLYDSLALPETSEYTCGHAADGTAVLFRYPTPGKENLRGYPAGSVPPDFDISGVYISEVCATGADEWIELRNGGDAPVSLRGWHLSRDREKLEQLALSGTLAPGGYTVIHGAELPSTGCRLFLTDGNGFFRDTYETGVIPRGLSSGRDARTGERRFYQTPTPGEENAQPGAPGYAPDVRFSENSLYQNAPFTLTLTAPGAEIYYTLDGTEPEEHGTLYTGPIPVGASTVVRAYAKKEGYLDGPEAIRHFLFEEAHTVPVICIAMDADDFKRVYNVKERNQIAERVCAVSYYYPDGVQGTSMRCAVKAKGRGSLAFAQKSLTFKLRERFGTPFTDFPLFGRGVNEGIRYRAFCLRSGSQDRERAIIRDTVINRAAQPTAVDAVKTQPAAVYVNGAYLGLYMLQEEMNADYYVSHYGIEKTDLDVINQKAGVRAGNADGFAALRKYARTVKGSDAEYAKLCTMLDVDAFTDYTAIQLIVGNTDVLNQKVVQSRAGNLPFRPMLFDEDSAFGSKKTDLMYTYFRSAGFTPSSGNQILAYNDVFKALYHCPAWCVKFWHRTVELLNTDLSAENLNAIIDALVEEMEPEMPRHLRKYGTHASVAVWKEKVGELKGVIAARKTAVYGQLKEYFKISDADIRAYEKEIAAGQR